MAVSQSCAIRRATSSAYSPLRVGSRESQVDAVLTATALHWLPQDAVRRLYRDLAVLVGERMPLADLPRLRRALAEIEQPGSDDRRARWDAWWEQASREPALQPAVTRRQAVFETTYPTEEFSPPADWHIAALRNAGFAEGGLVWRSGPAAVIAAVR